MAEFVEQDLEELVPVLEQLRATELLTPDEVSQLAKRCRRYDYRLYKIQKKAEDFLNYASYLRDLLKLLEERRKAIGYDHKKKLIEGNIENKCARLYRRLCERFKGNLDYWWAYVRFVVAHNMKMHASRAFVAAIQIHPHSIEMRTAAAKFEMKHNHSVENARKGLQLALRLHPESIDLWSALYWVEMTYVRSLKKRTNVLLNEFLKDRREAQIARGEVPDPEPELTQPPREKRDVIMRFRLAEIVLEQAFAQFDSETTERKRDLALAFWRVTITADDDESLLKGILEEKIEEELGADEDTRRVMKVEMRVAAGENAVEVLDEEEWTETTSVAMRRAARAILKREGEKDAIARARARGHLKAICERDEGKLATEEELGEWLHGGEEEGSEEEEKRARVAETAVERFPSRAVFWRVLLTHRKRQAGEDKEALGALAKEVDKAIQKVSGDTTDVASVGGLYKLAIDTALEHFPAKADKVFKAALTSTTGEVNAELKKTRLEYLISLVEEGKEPAKVWPRVEAELRSLVDSKPNSMSFYLSLCSSLLSLPSALCPSASALIDTVTEAAVIEHPEDDDAWITRCELLLERDPLKVADVYRRAMLALKDEDASQSFIARYTKLQQKAATVPSGSSA